MNELDKYKEKIKEPLRQATLMFLIKDNKILLALKKRGFAVGKWNGMGGKPEPKDKSIIETAIRETLEEVNVTPINPIRVATLNFYFPENPVWSQQVAVFLAKQWSGEATETDEMMPKWFNVNEIPFEKMWEDDKFWLPQIINGTFIEADFLLDNNQRMIEKNIREITLH
ncbi:hypothetical protein A2422_02890 [Candidatus Woesebacteria bacterium RIFOXYC1_FULL_31_51]|uniref:Oxidized purine nucleoside triphosphate hydrolase n=1 Tax=Candidatus Woesebacteria bacterium GW2011_GWC2_31_9 TaxID=1618586 RepID=A0A0F9YHL0_9BACT|nr:MAG: putative NUDIX hydrolase [Candidatus Woesebacteria bacterium GW2011_GWF1_31_35]KKP23420.1 MAG: NUDIX hydrolase [Candidatus Woesebacteria bacterium GW2011_GWC1_30_29]KKP26397.1 MAG: NUDIX hydrolase [Candidatus Woesebacteria bacterium GW2011_GWD1_31_12]KKP27696.1 MAG: NUDIX hydrolase [Candidatus Woesebacteria bacterium GW2011_GWB1_31_29]KKP30913.1 MAG: NUDIX hydrolase [Candidatus Woesebacteria bacterium GW2011_GWC2_31_9]KKP34264.1 MAG: NUDIX hydrolase [Candidatus Woesebacteria bacterium 